MTDFRVVFIGVVVIVCACSVSGCPDIVSRAMWGARSPRTSPSRMKITPTPYVIIHHTATSSCNTPDECAARVRSIQSYHINNQGWNDIGYSYLIGGDGQVYEGRSWNSQGAHAGPNYNSKSVGIALIGDFSVSLPPVIMKTVTEQLIACGVRSAKITENYKLLGHRQVKSTSCPGRNFFAQLKSWPHWSSSP